MKNILKIYFIAALITCCIHDFALAMASRTSGTSNRERSMRFPDGQSLPDSKHTYAEDAVNNANDATRNPNDATSNPNNALRNPNNALSNPNNALRSPNNATRYPNDATRHPNGS